MSTSSNPLNLNFFDAVKLSKHAGKSTIPGLSGTSFTFDDYFKAKVVSSYIAETYGDCTPVFRLNKDYTFVCKVMDEAMFNHLRDEANREQTELSDILHLSIDANSAIN